MSPLTLKRTQQKVFRFKFVSFIKNCNFYLGAPAGMYFLKKNPDGSSEIRPDSFIQGSRAELDGVTAKMENDCRVRSPIVANQ